MKNTQIGFKACLEEDNKPNTKTHIEPAQISAIEEDVEQRLTAEREYEEHMVNFHKLLTQNKWLKFILYSIGVLILGFFIYSVGYINGAKDQATGNGIYQSIVDKDGNTFIIKKQ